MPAEVDDLEQASAMVAKVAWGNEPAVVVGEAIEAMSRSRNREDAALLMAVRSFSARGEHRVDGHVNVAAWLQHTCRLKKRQALRIARLARFLDHQPILEAAMADGRISLDHLDLFADLHRERHAEAWTEAFPLLVDYATVARFEDVARAAQRFADDLSPTDADDRFREQVEGRTFTKATTIDGFGHLQGFLDPITYAIFAAEHDRLVGIEYQADLAIAREVLGRDPDPLELAQITRTPAQRSADALRVMAQRSKTLAGGAVAAAVEVVIHMTQDQYEAGVARDLGDPEASETPTGSASSTTAPSSPPSPPSTSPRSPTSGASSTAPTTRSSTTAKPAAATPRPNTGHCGPSTGAAPTPGAVTARDGSSKPTTSKNTVTAAPPTAATANASAASTTAGRPATNTTHPDRPRWTPAPAEQDPPTSAEPVRDNA